MAARSERDRATRGLGVGFGRVVVGAAVEILIMDRAHVEVETQAYVDGAGHKRFELHQDLDRVVGLGELDRESCGVVRRRHA